MITFTLFRDIAFFFSLRKRQMNLMLNLIEMVSNMKVPRYLTVQEEPSVSSIVVCRIFSHIISLFD